ncbi:hypothetical protein Q7C_977 [Methylophaga frappieri]|uniref:Uncharacterized protein n=1 Tax=Methylophaga frappieri (strain ATCC BAA-2434 / DSM 25690 / JAM7) TaxID=754477 RepID=I1YGV3_METFJ|nr:hypothetical protein [Methylophaga frappieri]AFJ02146.1 hypothetical protein Q7C_977 [Methylophaga frappieri]
MTVSKWILLVSILSLSLSAQADPSNDEVIGTWHATIHNNVTESTLWLLQLKADNTYVSLKMLCEIKKLIWVDEQTGTWELNGTSLVQMPKTYSDFNVYKESDSAKSITFSDVSVTEDELDFKDANQKDRVFKRHDGFFEMRCSGAL